MHEGLWKVTTIGHQAKQSCSILRTSSHVITVALLLLATVACGLMGSSDEGSGGQTPPVQTEIRSSLQARDAHTATLLQDGRSS